MRLLIGIVAFTLTWLWLAPAIDAAGTKFASGTPTINFVPRDDPDSVDPPPAGGETDPEGDDSGGDDRPVET